MRVFLVGFPLCGKTTVGKKLARLLDLRFIDTDSVFEQKNDTTIPVFLTSHTQSEFRQAEREALLSVIKEDNCVISTGGGLPCFFDNMDLILKNGVCVYLYISETAILNRLKNSKTQRPLLKFENDTDTMQHIHSLLQERELFYNRANIIIKAESVDMKFLVTLIKEEMNL